MPPSSPENKIVSYAKVHYLKAAIFNTMAHKMSVEINKDAISNATKCSFLKILFNVCRIKQNNVNFEQYFRLHLAGTQFAICETVSDSVFVLSTPFSKNDQYFQVALEEAIDAFNAVLTDFGYKQKLEKYDAATYQKYPKKPHPFWN